MTELTISTHVVGEGQDAITYDVQGDLSTGVPLFLFGAPMDASGFRQLAEQFPDRAVVTYDPRGTGRNATGVADITTAEHAEDVHRVIEALGVGPVDAFGSSGGAVNLLTLAARHPADVRTVVAHEPPSAPLLPDADEVRAVISDLKRTYAEEGNGPAMAKFIGFVMYDGVVPAGYLEQPAPDPAMFGMSAEDDRDRTNPLFRNMPSIIVDPVDVDALRGLGDRLVLAYGVESGQTMAARGARAIAAAVGIEPTEFPGSHGSFHDEPMYPGIPVEFGVRLREVLDR
ncbi:alpha/beta fold hydrolase [Microbacterium sp. ASV49]|uniref:Alpha/beta hydrolase n=1 Tax=Microbacterium candidum TaxID=3041922 RepID=A0ABT7MUI4_9MICO|nr:alpha/beta hydrolase [Microbacterium sp. ASV49]MDL9978113.1 alpha/beta hydrolase [Microbacterium sp. ASV49]